MRYFIKSVLFALQGFYAFFKTERNGKIQGVIAVLTIIAGAGFQISRTEWLFLLVCMGVVISFEMLNSAIEGLCNLYSASFHPAIKRIKDIAAGAVLWTSIMAVITGLFIFLPHILRFFK